MAALRGLHAEHLASIKKKSENSSVSSNPVESSVPESPSWLKNRHAEEAKRHVSLSSLSTVTKALHKFRGALKKNKKVGSDESKPKSDKIEVDEEVKGATKKGKSVSSETFKAKQNSGVTIDIEKKIRDLFNQIDKDHSGTLTKKEVGKLAKQMGDKLTTMFSHKKLDVAFTEMEPNDDGKVTIEEFIEWHHRNHPTEPKHLYAQLLHLFNVIDVLHKDALNRKDVSKLLKLAGNQLTGKYKLKKTKSIDDACQEMDKTGTGSVSHEEFVLWYCSHHNVEPPIDYVEDIKTLQKEARKGVAGETFEVEKKIRYLFNQIDEDHSGTLTKKEVGKLAKQMGDKLTTMFSHKKLDVAFTEMEPNDDGKVTIEEFIEWHHRNHPTEPKHLYAQLLHLFNVIDVLHKDALNRKDVSKLLKLAGNQLTGKYKLKKTKSIDDACQEMDKTGTGSVSHEEFVLWYCSHHNVEPPIDYVEHIKKAKNDVMPANSRPEEKESNADVSLRTALSSTLHFGGLRQEERHFDESLKVSENFQDVCEEFPPRIGPLSRIYNYLNRRFTVEALNDDSMGKWDGKRGHRQSFGNKEYLKWQKQMKKGWTNENLSKEEAKTTFFSMMRSLYGNKYNLKTLLTDSPPPGRNDHPNRKSKKHWRKDMLRIHLDARNFHYEPFVEKVDALSRKVFSSILSPPEKSRKKKENEIASITKTNTESQEKKQMEEENDDIPNDFEFNYFVSDRGKSILHEFNIDEERTLFICEKDAINDRLYKLSLDVDDLCTIMISQDDGKIHLHEFEYALKIIEVDFKTSRIHQLFDYLVPEGTFEDEGLHSSKTISVDIIRSFLGEKTILMKDFKMFDEYRRVKGIDACLRDLRSIIWRNGSKECERIEHKGEKSNETLLELGLKRMRRLIIHQKTRNEVTIRLSTFIEIMVKKCYMSRCLAVFVTEFFTHTTGIDRDIFGGQDFQVDYDAFFEWLRSKI
eukprot:g14266.t1